MYLIYNEASGVYFSSTWVCHCVIIRTKKCSNIDLLFECAVSFRIVNFQKLQKLIELTGELMCFEIHCIIMPESWR